MSRGIPQNLAIAGVARALAYWEDELTITALDVNNDPIIGALLDFRPGVRIRGTITAEGDDDSNFAGFTGWGFGYSINQFTAVIGAGGFCNVPQSAVVAQCPGPDFIGDAFGTFGPFQTVQVASGVPFTSRGQVWASVASENSEPMRGEANLDSAVRWQGFTVFDAMGKQITNFTVSSASGINWRLASVPEPSTPLLQAARLLAIAWLYQTRLDRRRMRTAKR